MEFIIFPDKDAAFTLYDDAGDGYGYEKGEFIQLPFTWDDQRRQLTIGALQGAYPGMPEERTFCIRLINEAPVEIHYTGQEITLTL